MGITIADLRAADETRAEKNKVEKDGRFSPVSQVCSMEYSSLAELFNE